MCIHKQKAVLENIILNEYLFSKFNKNLQIYHLISI